MHSRLRQLLFEYLTRQAPELLINGGAKRSLDGLLSITVEQVSGIEEWLLSKGIPADRVEVICCDLMTRRWRPSKYHYIAGLLATYQPAQYALWRENGTLTYQVSRLIDQCGPAFGAFCFSPANTGDQALTVAICNIIESYIHPTGIAQ
ncbi:hypothetical protein DCC81_03685 [Chitinophaga parva]|uniref:Uncharacterized protein n=1 Tax=Chitinophaga parva TaxID=2169414 RepID=A0A2T7BLN7_9BACT|nr:hypothetical protein [Chitinophaga parva]PUZ28595.1 hypothetical protein DCC81_03685 [Chitinophaga parva]